MQNVHRDFRWAVKSCGDSAAACPRGGIALQRSALPASSDEFSGEVLDRTHDMAASREAELSTMSVSREHHLEVVLSGFGVSLGRVTEKDGAGVVWDARGRFREIVRLVEVRVVDTCDPEFFVLAFERC